MKKALLIALLSSAPAMAQQYVPITLDQKTFSEIYNYANELPTKYGAPIVGTLTALEQQAQKAAAEEAAKAKSEPKKE